MEIVNHSERSVLHTYTCLTPTVLLDNIIMDQIDCVTNYGREYNLNTGAIKIICYKDDAVIVAEDQDDLHRLLYSLS